MIAGSALALAACNIDPFSISSATGDGGTGPHDGGDSSDGGGGGIADAAPDARVPDAGPDACPASPEVCDEMDNDCDGEIDEAFNLEMDPANCGSCGFRCARPNMAGTCGAGECSFTCLPGWVDLDEDIDANGCEYLCAPTNGGVEACDFSDNDCDGEIDEGFNLDTDVDNCGGCGRPCIVLNADPACVDGACTHSGCHDGFEDVIPGVPGCEYTCPEFPTTAETCDTVDNDCDGTIDESPIDGLGDPCVPPGFEAFGDKGECELGATACSFGTPVCSGYVGPTGEVCDQLDNDCDDLIDETFNKMTDPRHCGPTCVDCQLDNAVEGCSAGSCTVAACHAGWVDADNDPSNGCEYACTPSGPEVCDGRDNDCDTLTDTADPDLSPPPNFCLAAGGCAGTMPTCTATACEPTVVKWRCVYDDDTTEANLCGQLPLQEARCDDLDGDCDGRVDESFGNKGGTCNDGLLGECRGTGVFVCNAAGTATECDITDPGATPTAGEIACDNRDEDCDGEPDDGAPDSMVRVTHSGLDFWIDAYEASRPDATDDSAGIAEHRSCSNPDVMPWRSASWLDADAACALAGKRLCTEAEWQAACEGSMDNIYPYGDVYDPLACNGDDYDHDCVAPDEDICLPTDTAYGCPAPATSACVSDDGAVDLSGNLKEWTSTAVGAGARRIRGGSYDSVAGGLTCQWAFVSGGETFFFDNLGFRCCMDP